MREPDVQRAVLEVIDELKAEGKAVPWDCYVVNPMTVWNAIERSRPDVAAHIRRYYRGDPYQQVKVWVPTTR